MHLLATPPVGIRGANRTREPVSDVILVLEYPTVSSSAPRLSTLDASKGEWDRRDSNTGPTHPMRRGYHYPTVPRFEAGLSAG